MRVAARIARIRRDRSERAADAARDQQRRQRHAEVIAVAPRRVHRKKIGRPDENLDDVRREGNVRNELRIALKPDQAAHKPERRLGAPALASGKLAGNITDQS
ncbi:hypothetical protein J4558_27480 [Leptolyngbya sp. 15MV]|nr:hypothetical protein J4558_27480 [Leptolyngbya sp. 15MV]